MKIKIIVFTFILTLANFCYASSPHPLESVVNQINTFWVDKNNAAILQTINDRLAADENDTFALSVKYNYFMYADIDLNEARAAIDKLYNNVNALGNQPLTNFIKSFRDETFAIPLSESIPFTQAEKDAIHNIFRQSFPAIKTSYDIALRVEALENE